MQPQRHAVRRDMQDAVVIRHGTRERDRDASRHGGRFRLNVQHEHSAVRMAVLPSYSTHQARDSCGDQAQSITADDGLVGATHASLGLVLRTR